MLVTVYKTTNLINGKYYIGVHRVKNESCINDSYLGSGVCIKKAFKKHGKSNFKKEVLFVYDNYESAYLKEAELVTEETIKMKSVYNQYPGGLGGRKYKPSKEHVESNRLAQQKYWSSPDGKAKSASMTKRSGEPEVRKKISDGMKKWHRENEIPQHIRDAQSEFMKKWRKENPISESTREEMSNRIKGDKNPMYGKIPSNAKILIADGVEYETATACSKHLGISKGLITYRVNSPKWDWHYKENKHA